MTDTSWVKLYRKIFDNPIICKSHDVFFFWCWLLAHVNYEKTKVVFKGKEVELKPGQLLVTVSELCLNCDLSVKQIRNYLEVLKKGKQIGIQTSNKNQVITVLNWKLYQEKGQTKGQTKGKRRANEGQTKGKPTLYKEFKEGEEYQEGDNAEAPENSKSDFSKAVEIYQNNIALITEYAAEEIDELIKEFGLAVFEQGVRAAVKNNVRKLSYIAAVCKGGGEQRAKSPPPKTNGNNTDDAFAEFNRRMESGEYNELSKS